MEGGGSPNPRFLSSVVCFFLLGFFSRQGILCLLRVRPPSSGCEIAMTTPELPEYVAQARLRRDNATTCAHCFSLIFTVSGGSPAKHRHQKVKPKLQ